MNLFILENEAHLNYYLHNLKKNNDFVSTTSPTVSDRLKKLEIKHDLYNYNKIYNALVKRDFVSINKILHNLKKLENKINAELNLKSKYSIIDLNSYCLNFLLGDYLTKYEIYKNLLLPYQNNKIFKKIFFLTDFYEDKFPSERNNHNFIFAINREGHYKKNPINVIQVKKKKQVSFKTFLKNKFKNLLFNFLMSYNNLKNFLLEKKNIKILYLNHREKKYLITQKKILSYDMNIFSESIMNFSTTSFTKEFLKKKFKNNFFDNKKNYTDIYDKWLHYLKINSNEKKMLFFLKNEIIFFLIIVPKLIKNFELKIKKKLEIIEPNFIFSYNSTSWLDNFIILLAKNYKIKSAYVQHGGGLGTALVPKNEFFLNKTNFLFTYGTQNKFFTPKFLKINYKIFPTGNIELLKKNLIFQKNKKNNINKILYISDGNETVNSIKRKMTDLTLYQTQKKILCFLYKLNKFKISYRPWIHKLQDNGITNYIKENLNGIKIESINDIQSQILRNDLIITDSVSAANLYKGLVLNKHIFFIYDEKVSFFSQTFLSDLKKVVIVVKNMNEIVKLLKNIKNEKIYYTLNVKKNKDKKDFIKKYIFGGKKSFNSYHLYNSTINI